jgi:hypothetical protein
MSRTREGQTTVPGLGTPLGPVEQVRQPKREYCTAGSSDGMVLVQIDRTTYKDKPRNYTILSVSGITEESGHREHVSWGGLHRLSVGDVVTVKVVEVGHADEATERERVKKR